MKSIVVYLLHHFGTKFKSELMIEASKESRADFISTCVVLAILILSFFENYIPDFINIDKIGSLGMSIYVFYTSIKMIISNSCLYTLKVSWRMKIKILNLILIFPSKYI